MDLAERIWRLVRDVILLLLGVFVVVMLALGAVPPEVGPSLVPVAVGLFALPAWLRRDERKERERDDDDR
jgi:hypothetical protein